MSLHAAALDALEAWEAPDREQERLRVRYLAHLRARPDALERACRPDHLTASTLVLSHDHRRALLTLHAKAGRWFQLGGHCEPVDATVAAAAERECIEESGIASLRVDPVPLELDEHEVAFCGADAGDDLLAHHLDVRFVAVADAGTVHEISAESLDLRWWPVEEVPADLTSLVGRALARVGVHAPGRPGGPGGADEDAQPPVWSSGGGSTREASDQPSR